MSDIIKYSAEHAWILMDGPDTGKVGITGFAQEQLGEVVFVDLPAIGRRVSQGEDVSAIESAKTVSDCRAPVSGTIVEVNESLVSHPDKVNADPLGEGWFFRMKLADLAELAALMDEAGYQATLA